MLSSEPQGHTEEKNVSRCSSFLQYAKFTVCLYWKNVVQSKIEEYFSIIIITTTAINTFITTVIILLNLYFKYF